MTMLRPLLLTTIAACALLAMGPADAADRQLSLQALTETRDRPLFSPSRRPPPPDVPVPERVEPLLAVVSQAPPPPPAPPDVRLMGLMLLPNRQLAILEHAPTGEVIRLAAGAELDAWTLRIVDARSIAFELDGREARHVLFEQ
jgi:hypothetical protein